VTDIVILLYTFENQYNARSKATGFIKLANLPSPPQPETGGVKECVLYHGNLCSKSFINSR